MAKTGPGGSTTTPARWKPAGAGIAFGGDYNPEQWPEPVWEEDVRLMREAGVNLVSLGIFAWARLEPEPGRLDLAWLDRVLDLLAGAGVSAALATPTAAPPPWLVRAHPEILPVTVDGVTLWHGSRRHYCPHVPAYREAGLRIVRVIAERYAHHPAVGLWHVDNELGSFPYTDCYCPASAAAFRAWLQARHGDLRRLGDAWGTSVWSQGYTDWAEIEPPRRTPAAANPGQRLDWQRFWSDTWRDWFVAQVRILRSVAPDLPATTNFIGIHPPIDYWRLAAEEDIVSEDSYPDPADPRWMVETAMRGDLMRSLGGGKPWIVMESSLGLVNWRDRNVARRPGAFRLGSLQAVARGADAVMAFQWRQAQVGAERFLTGMVGHAGARGRVWEEVTALGRDLGRIGEIAGSRLRAEVAIVLDWESRWALEADGMLSHDLRQDERTADWYGALYRRGVTADFAHPEADLSGYRLVLAPELHLVSDAAAANLRGWVERGGTLVLGFFSGIVDPETRVRLGGYPAPFRELLGLTVEEHLPLAVGDANRVAFAGGPTVPCDLWTEVVRAEGAEVVATFTDDLLAGMPAVTRHPWGRGAAVYVATRLDPAGYDAVMAQAIAVAAIPAGPVPPAGLEVTVRTDGTRSWRFALNFGTEPVDLPVAVGVELLTGARVGGSLRIAPGDAAIVRTPG